MKKYSSKLKIFFYFLVGVFTFAILVFILWAGRGQESNAAIDSFAKCLSQQGVVMYGAEWCAHCQNEKKAFGTSFQYINYVECPKDPNKCLAAGIEGYPTWIFSDPSAGSINSPQASSGQVAKKLVGEQGLEKLSTESGCQLAN
ncbi:MAG: hypothetical protein AAB911_01675 [Patescibacteria group bacterium]